MCGGPQFFAWFGGDAAGIGCCFRVDSWRKPQDFGENRLSPSLVFRLPLQGDVSMVWNA